MIIKSINDELMVLYKNMIKGITKEDKIDNEYFVEIFVEFLFNSLEYMFSNPKLANMFLNTIIQSSSTLLRYYDNKQVIN